MVSRLLEDESEEEEAKEEEKEEEKEEVKEEAKEEVKEDVKEEVTKATHSGIMEVEEMDEYGRVVRNEQSSQANLHIVTTFTEDNQGFKAKLLTLNGLLEYTLKDTKEKVFEVSLLAETFKDMLLTRFSFVLYEVLASAADTMKEQQEEKKTPAGIKLSRVAFIACCTFDKKKKGYLSYDELMSIFINGNHVNCKSEAEIILDTVLDNKKLNYMKMYNEYYCLFEIIFFFTHGKSRDWIEDQSYVW